MPKPINKDGITFFELSPEEKRVVELTKRVEVLEKRMDKIEKQEVIK